MMVMDDAVAAPLPTPSAVRREPWVAFVANVVIVGLGHLYVGRRAMAVIAVATVALGVPLTVMLGLLTEMPLPWLLVHTLATGWLVKLLFAVDAARIARTIGALPPAQVPTRAVYLGFVLAAVLLELGASAVRERFVLEALRTPSGAMAPTLDDGDHFVVTKSRARDREARPGDLVVFRLPQDPSTRFVKRVVAIEGDRVEFSGADLWIDGTPTRRSPCPAGSGDDPAASSPWPDPVKCLREALPKGPEFSIFVLDEPREHDPAAGHIQVPAGHVFVLGDNRPFSHDSRSFGPVPLASIEGRARMLYWSHGRPALRELE